LVNTSGGLTSQGHTYADAFEVGLVEGGLGVVSLKPDRNGVVLRVKPILWNGAGADDNWMTAGNWNSAVTAKMLHFTGSTRLTPVNNNPAGTPFEGLQFVAGASAFTVSGNTIQLNGDIINQSSNAQTINLAMDLTAANLSIDAMRGNITISQPIGQSGGTYGIAKRGEGTLVLSGNNTYAGKTVIGAGILSVASLNSVVGGAANSNLGAPTSAANGTIDIGAAGTAGQLTYTGTGETTDRVINLAGTSGGNQGVDLAHNRPGGATLDQSGTGLLKFTSNLTATGGGNKTLLLQGSTAGTGEIAGAIINGSGTTFLGKAGTGTWTLSGASTYTGPTTIYAGTLGLNFSAATAPVTNIINNTGNNSALTLGGGTLSLTGKASTSNSQRFNGLTARAGSSAIVLNADVTANPLVLTLGALTRASGGGTVDFTLPTGTQDATNGVTTTSTTFLNNNVLTHAVNGTAFATVSGNDWATLNGTGNIVGYSSLHAYTTTTAAGTTAANYANFNIDADSSAGLLDGVITPNTLRFNSAAANTVTLAAGNNTIGAGGILVSSAVGGNASTITGGTLQGSTTGKDLVVIQNNTNVGGGLTIDSIIANNASATALTKSGPGTLTLGGSASNTYNGVTFANAGTLQLNKSSGNAIAGGGLTINPGATVQYTGASGDMMGTGQVNIYGTGQLDFNGKTDTIGAVTIASRGLKPVSDQITSSPDVGNTTPIINTAGGGNLTINRLNIYPAPGATTLINTGTGTLTLNADLRLAFTAAGAGRAQISGNLALPGTRTFGIESFGHANNDLYIDALISGSGGVNKNTLDGYQSIGRLTLSGANTYAGPTTIAAGVLSINSIKDVSGGASALGNPTTTGNGTILIGGVLTGTLEYTGGAQDTNRVISLGSGLGGATLDHSGTGLLKFTSNFTAPGAGGSDQRKTLTLQGSTGGTGEIAGIIPNSAAGLAGHTATSVTKTGTGTWDLNGNNTFTGPLTVDDGTLNVNGTLSTGLAVTVTDTANGAPTKLRFGTVSQTLGSLTIGAGATVIFTSGLASGSLTGDDGGGKAAGFGSPASSFGGGATVPEPGTLGLLLVGALGMLNRRRRQA
jgi:autotransporter-associated beta strand protein